MVRLFARFWARWKARKDTPHCLTPVGIPYVQSHDAAQHLAPQQVPFAVHPGGPIPALIPSRARDTSTGHWHQPLAVITSQHAAGQTLSKQLDLYESLAREMTQTNTKLQTKLECLYHMLESMADEYDTTADQEDTVQQLAQDGNVRVLHTGVLPTANTKAVLCRQIANRIKGVLDSA